MNIFHSFTRKSLRENRTRTLVTIIGIVLSMALFTAVFQGANSGLAYLVRVEAARTGLFHGYYSELSDAQLEAARSVDGFETTTAWQEVGWAQIGSQNEYKPYLLIKSIDDNFTDLVAVNLLSGRMPENENEILLPEHLAVNGGATYKLGDALTLDVGVRMSDGYALGEKHPYDPETPEEILLAEERSYTVVGFYTRFEWMIEGYSCPGYTALTVGGGNGSHGLFFSVEHPLFFHRFMEKVDIGANYVANQDLLMYSGTLEDNGLMMLLWGFVAVLVFLIAFGSISLIYNSFSISVSERTRQFGILKSVGATKKQIRAAVLYEAMLLCLIAMPIGILIGCAGIGVTLWCLRDSFTFLMGAGLNIKMYLVISPAGIILSVIACTATTLISACLPARRAVRIPPIESIRQSKDVRIRRRDVRVSWLTKKLFGFEGMIAAKNFGRNRRRYRGTILSLFMSITLFIAASSFCSYLNAAVMGISSSSGDTGADISYRQHQTDDSSPDSTLALLNVEGVQGTSYSTAAYAFIMFGEEAFSADYSAYLNEIYAESLPSPTFGIGTSVYCLDDNSFRLLCAENGIDPAPYFNADAPMGIALNRVTDTYIIDGQRRWTTLDVLDPAALPLTGHQERSMTVPGYWLQNSKADEFGNVYYYYYPDEYWDDYRNGRWEADESLALILPESEATVYAGFTVGAVVNDRAYYLPGETDFALIYPYSMRGFIGDSGFREEYDEPSYFIIAGDHRSVFDRIHKALTAAGRSTVYLTNLAQEHEEERMAITVVNVFSYGFIILISLIAMANVFNTISTSVALRRHEFAMLKSVGLTNRGFARMMNFECMIYGLRALILGLPAAFLLSYAIYRITDISYEVEFYVPASSVVIAMGSIFIVVFTTMLYATRRIRRDNPIDALRNENL